MSRASRARRRATRLEPLAAEYRDMRRWLTAAGVALFAETTVLLWLLADRIG